MGNNVIDKKCYVFRINYDVNYPRLKEEILKGRLRQGWGAEGFDLTRGEDSYVQAYKAEWGSEESDIRKRYRYLQPMLNMEIGDLIVIPKMDITNKKTYLPNVFTIAEVTGKYHFDVLEGTGDFGHIVDINPIASFNYWNSDETRKIQRSFSGYQKCVNNVRSSTIADAIKTLYEKAPTEDKQSFLKNHDPLQSLAEATREARDKYAKSLIETIRTWSGNQFESMLKSLFEKQGYLDPERNQHDGKGGDVDLLYDTTFPQNSLMNDILENSGLNSLPAIHIQAKCKEGTDTDDIEGINQLIEYEKNHGSDINTIKLFITTAETISDKAKDEAKKNEVVLVDAKKLARLIMKYGIESEML